MIRRYARCCGLALLRLVLAGPALVAHALVVHALAAGTDVVTYHYDNQRSGWDPNETALTPAAIASGQFGLLHTVALDGQVDSQPLIVRNAVIDGDPNPGTHDVAFVVTSNDTVYAIDPTRGTVLLARSLGTPVPKPLGCHSSSATVGILSTPVIDATAGLMWLITYTQEAAGPTYRVHRLALHNLTDLVAARIVTGTHTLTDGSTGSFQATVQRQRAGLILVQDVVYAAFASFCDLRYDVVRGWVLGWRQADLAPMPFNTATTTTPGPLTNTRASSPRTDFLTSIWMSGFAPAADGNGNIYFATGNSDPAGTYDVNANLPESVIKFSPASNSVTGSFTPSNYLQMEATDGDLSSGGVMLLPAAVSVAGWQTPQRLAVAAGKDGRMFVLNTAKLGGFTPGGPDHTVGMVQIGPCWCGPSYFNDGQPNIVSSGGNTVMVWQFAAGQLQAVASGAITASGGAQDPGFFTVVTSNGAATPVIWAVSRPPMTGSDPIALTLYAFDAHPAAGTSTLPLLYSGIAGNWVYTRGNANVTPIAANGLVYVATYGQLSIFGLGTP